jgi:hypothetical protein
MKELLKGIASFDHILTEEDALRHSGATVAADAVSDTVPPEAPAPARTPEVPPPPPAEETQAEETQAEGTQAEGIQAEEVQLTDEELAKKLESENTKDALIAMAEAADVDSTGVKAEIAARLVAHYRSQQ